MSVVAVLAVLVGGGLAAATGFGFALVAAPLLVASLGAEPAVTAAVLLSVEVNALTLLTERRRPELLGGEVRQLLAWALPGLALGAVILTALSDHALQLVVAVGVLGGLALRLRARRGEAPPPRDRPAWSGPVAGLSAGALTTATSLNGPPLVLHLAGTRATPAQVRDTLALLFGLLGLAGAVALVAAGAFDVPDELPLLLVAAAVGHVGGRRLFGILDGDRYERAVTAVLAATAIAAAATAF